MDVKHPQSFFISAGKYACYALCIVELARRYLKSNGRPYAHINDYDSLIGGITKGYIDFDFHNYENYNNFYVKRPDLFLTYLVGEDFNVKITDSKYKEADGEMSVLFWAKDFESSKKGIGHFTLNGFNSLEKSQTVMNGIVYSKRVFFIK